MRTVSCILARNSFCSTRMRSIFREPLISNAYFTPFLSHEGRLAHIDIIVNATDLEKRSVELNKAFSDAIDKAWPNPWGSFCYGETIRTDHELTRFFYIEKEG